MSILTIPVTLILFFFFFFFNDTATTEIYTLSLHDALPIFAPERMLDGHRPGPTLGSLALHPEVAAHVGADRSEEHTSELQSQSNLVCRLLLEKKKTTTDIYPINRFTQRTACSSVYCRSRSC